MPRPLVQVGVTGPDVMDAELTLGLPPGPLPSHVNRQNLPPNG
jgi:hypothetical protein